MSTTVRNLSVVLVYGVDNSGFLKIIKTIFKVDLKCRERFLLRLRI